MRLLFLGAGAIGSYLGGSLAAAGHQVTFSEQPGAAKQIAEQGIQLTTADGLTRTVTGFGVFDNVTDALQSADHDLVVVALKSFDTEAAIDALIATGATLPAILTVQNGVENEALIARRVGDANVLSGSITTAVGKPGVGQVVEEKRRGIAVAADHPLADALISALNDANLNAVACSDRGSMKWSKLLTNLTGNATSAILDLPVAALFADQRVYRLEVDVLRECLAVMRALGYHPIDLPGTPVRALAVATRLPRFIAQPALTRALGSGRGDKMPSFHIDLHGGRGRTEVGYLNGAVARCGARVGVATPVNRLLTSVLEELSAGTADIETFRHRPEALISLL